MNVYFLNPKYLNLERLHILLEILKVKRIFNIIHENEKDNAAVKICRAFCECLDFYYDQDLDECLKPAANAFVKPMVESSIMTDIGVKYTYKDLYNNSKAFNPIYNLEYNNDDNLLILYAGYTGDSICSDGSGFYEKYAFYLHNILKKYANRFHYEDKICFVLFENERYITGYYNYILFFKETSIYYRGRFKSLTRFVPLNGNGTPHEPIESYHISNIPNQYQNYIGYDGKLITNGNYYDPIMSYIRAKLRTLYSEMLQDLDFMEFFLNNSYFLEYMESIISGDKYIESKNCRYDCSYNEYDSDSWDAESEMNDMLNNGGDWMFD